MRALLGAILLLSAPAFADENPKSFNLRFQNPTTGDTFECRFGNSIRRCDCSVNMSGDYLKSEQNYLRECFKKLYDSQSTDKMISDLRAVQAAQMQTIKALIDQNYRTIANDPQFTTYINQRINQILKERGL